MCIMYLEYGFDTETINRSFHFNKFTKSIFINNFEYFLLHFIATRTEQSEITNDVGVTPPSLLLLT